MIFVDEIWRVGRSAPLINSKFPAIIIPKHRAKTPRTKEKEKEEKKKKDNWGVAQPPPTRSGIA